MTTVVFNRETMSDEDNMSIDAGTWERPYTSLIFIVIDWTGENFSFLNKTSMRMGFKWERWRPFKKHLRPYTFHCFKIEGYRTGSPSGSGFRPVEHIAEFPGIDVARFFNRAYLTNWQTFHDTLDPDEVSKETELFCEKLERFASDTFASFLDVLGDTVETVFRNEISKADFEWVMSIQGNPPTPTNIDWSEREIPEWLEGFADWVAELEERY